MDVMPKWAEVILVPLISLLLAAILSALVILGIGEDPVAAVKLMVQGALGSTYGWGYTLYYATNFMFTGLAVAVAFHARLFNIGGEGQATLGGLGVALACLMVPWPHWTLALIFASLGAALFGAAWAAIPAYLQARRGSHIVITTIMFNFIAAAVLNYMLVNVMRPAGSMDPASARFPEATHLPTLHELLLPLGINCSTAAPLSRCTCAGQTRSASTPLAAPSPAACCAWRSCAPTACPRSLRASSSPRTSATTLAYRYQGLRAPDVAAGRLGRSGLEKLESITYQRSWSRGRRAGSRPLRCQRTTEGVVCGMPRERGVCVRQGV